MDTWSHSAVGKVSDSRYVPDCRSRVASSILARSHTLVEINHKIISRAILLPSSDSRRLAVIYKVN